MYSNCWRKPTTTNLSREFNRRRSRCESEPVGFGPRQLFCVAESLANMSQKNAKGTVTVVNPQGLHARPVDLFTKLANRFESEIKVTKEDKHVDGKSILDVLTLAAEQGTQLTIEANGDDAAAAISALTELVESGFAEEENVNHPQ